MPHPPPAIAIIQRGGWMGVDLFFVLSGFLVSGLLFGEKKAAGDVNIKRFLIRRGFKIYPPFWALLLFTVFLRALHNENIVARALFGEIVFLQNYTSYLWPHTWSLAVEEHFYFLLAVLCLLMFRGILGLKIRFFPIIFLGVAVACLAARIAAWHAYPEFSFKRHVFPTHLRIDSLLFGVVLSYGFHFLDLGKRIARIPSLILLLVGAILLSPAFIFPLEQHPWISVYGFISMYVGSGFLVMAAIRLSNSRLGSLNFLGHLGSTSYSIYLWHMPVNSLMLWIFRDSQGYGFLLYLFCYLSGSMLCGVLMAKLVEIPSLKIRNRLFPK